MKPITISKNYRITILCEIRKQFGLKPGQKVMFIPYDNTLRMSIIPPIEQARGIFKGIELK